MCQGAMPVVHSYHTGVSDRSTVVPQTLRFNRCLPLILCALLLQACASSAPVPVVASDYSEYLLGQWNTQMNGFPVRVEYTRTTIGVVGFDRQVPYTLEENVISFEFQGLQQYDIGRVNENEMTQITVGASVATQTVTEFFRHQEQESR